MTDQVFVNPYAFVPLPPEVRRAKPVLHVGQAEGVELYSGTIDVTWKLVTPLVLPGSAKNAAFARDEGWIQPDGSIRIPGSSIKGAVRSLHEALFNGCFRVVDEDYVPGYRDPAGNPPDEADWTLAVVLEANEEGRPTRFQLCDKDSEFWVDSIALKRAWNRVSATVPTSGDIVRLSGVVERVDFGTSRDIPLVRDEMREVRSVEIVSRVDGHRRSDGELPNEMVFLPTDPGVRRKTLKDGSPGRCLWAAASLSPSTVRIDLDDDDDPGKAAVEQFVRTCAGTNDRRVLEQEKDDSWTRQTAYISVHWPKNSGNVVARRARQTGYLHRGDVVWLKVNDEDEVEGIRLARIWRHPGKGTVKQRLGEAAPCQPDHEINLCLTCAIFGAAETSGSSGGKGEQNAYAGHVRFSSARSKPGVTLRTVNLAPMGTPSPGSGMFYLHLPAALDNDGEPNEVASYWGSTSDAMARIRGRKFYWHGDPDQQARELSNSLGQRAIPRYEASVDQQRGKMSRPAQLVPKGVEFTVRISVDRLDRVAVETLLAALDPARVLGLVPNADTSHLAIHLSGGKPFGLGSAHIARAPEVNLTRTRDRYDPAGTDRAEWGAKTSVDTVRKIADRVGRFTANLPTIARLLDLNGLGGKQHLLAYPPGAAWDDIGTKQFRESFTFFQEANGQQLSGYRRPWRPLPSAAPGSDVTIPIELPRKKEGRR